MTFDFQPVFEAGEHANSALGYRDDVFCADAAETWIIQSRFHRQHLSDLENGFLKARMFVNLQAESVSGAVEKSGLAAVANFRRITAIGKKLHGGPSRSSEGWPLLTGKNQLGKYATVDG